MTRYLVQLLLVVALLTTVRGTEAPLPLLDPSDYGNFSRKVTTRSRDAQRWFNQGMALVYSFDHDNAIRCFQEAARIDPDCAMAWWGIAYSCGMHINLPIVTPSRAALAWESIGKARTAAAKGAAPVEVAMIDAQAKRFAENMPEDHTAYDRAYADAMRTVWNRFPGDADVGVLFADAMMDLRPWDLWAPDGSPQPGTDEILSTLEAVLKFAPSHPQALHLYIHCIEGSPNPSRAKFAADRLRGMEPALGHMVHMPSHIDVLTGNWDQCIEENAAAIRADARTRRSFGTPPGFLWLYMGHNRHMLAFGAMMSGRRDEAVASIRDLMAELPFETEWAKDWGFVADYFGPMQYEVMIRFGEWDAILKLPEPPARQPLSRTFLHVARGIAFAATGDAASARREQQAFREARDRVPGDAYAGNNTAPQVLAVADAMLDGEILLRERRSDEALARLREAVKLEDGLRYNEPPDWILPVRHSLGAALMTLGRYNEAEAVYRADLRKWPDNGWSLYGLSQTLKHLGQKEEAAAIAGRFQKVWAKSGIQLTSSCLCQPGAGAEK